MAVDRIYTYACSRCENATAVIDTNVGLYGDDYPVLPSGWTEREDLLCPGCSMEAGVQVRAQYHVEGELGSDFVLRFRILEQNGDAQHIIDGFVNYLACAGIKAERVYVWRNK